MRGEGEKINITITGGQRDFMEFLTREQAIMRVRDIRQLKAVGHLIRASCAYKVDLMLGAELELIAIFDIKEGEL